MADPIHSEAPRNIFGKEVYQLDLVPLLSEGSVRQLMDAELERTPTNTEESALRTRVHQLNGVLVEAQLDNDITEEQWQDMDTRMRAVKSVSELVELANELKMKLEQKS